MRYASWLLLPLLLTTACARLPDDATPAETPGEEEATICRIQTGIFDPSCVSCHSGPGAASELDLSAGVAYASLVNVPSIEAPLDLVEPGSSARSYLYHKVAGTQAEVGGGGSTMPLGGSLSEAQLELIRTWIDEGASEVCDAETPTPEPTSTPTPGR